MSIIMMVERFYIEDWLSEMGIELLYTPVYSPDLNSIESSFGKVKAVLNGQLQQIVQENLKLAIVQAIETISSNDMKGYYKNPSYLFIMCKTCSSRRLSEQYCNGILGTNWHVFLFKIKFHFVYPSILFILRVIAATCNKK
jgi:hypothetical protein